MEVLSTFLTIISWIIISWVGLIMVLWLYYLGTIKPWEKVKLRVNIFYIIPIALAISWVVNN